MSHKIKVLYFAGVKDITEKEQEEVTLKENSTLRDLSEILTNKYGSALQQLLSTSIYAVDMEYIDKQQESSLVLSSGQEIAIIPPVSGG